MPADPIRVREHHANDVAGHNTHGDRAGGTYTWWETDFQPAFSADGKRVAYIHARSLLVSTAFGFVSKPSLRIADADGSKDRSVIEFDPGQYVSHVSWSPEGARLVFDLGHQVVSGGFPYPLADPATDALFIVNTDGTGLRKLQEPPVTWPVWSSVPGPSQPPAPPIVGITLSPRRDQITLSWPTEAGNWSLEASPQLGNKATWQAVAGRISTSGSQRTLTLAAPDVTRFYRLRGL